MKVVIENDAFDGLEGIFAWIVQDDPNAASSVIDRIFEQIEQLGRIRLMESEEILSRAPESTRRAASTK